MIARNHGLAVEVESFGTIAINIYPSPTVYVGSDEDHDNPKCEGVWEWAVKWAERAKLRFPDCSFSVSTGIHDADYRVYAEIVIQSRNGNHKKAADWLIWETDS